MERNPATEQPQPITPITADGNADVGLVSPEVATTIAKNATPETDGQGWRDRAMRLAISTSNIWKGNGLSTALQEKSDELSAASAAESRLNRRIRLGLVAAAAGAAALASAPATAMSLTPALRGLGVVGDIDLPGDGGEPVVDLDSNDIELASKVIPDSDADVMNPAVPEVDAKPDADGFNPDMSPEDIEVADTAEPLEEYKYRNDGKYYEDGNPNYETGESLFDKGTAWHTVEKELLKQGFNAEQIRTLTEDGTVGGMVGELLEYNNLTDEGAKGLTPEELSKLNLPDDWQTKIDTRDYYPPDAGHDYPGSGDNDPRPAEDAGHDYPGSGDNDPRPADLATQNANGSESLELPLTDEEAKQLQDSASEFFDGLDQGQTEALQNGINDAVSELPADKLGDLYANTALANSDPSQLHNLPIPMNNGEIDSAFLNNLQDFIQNNPELKDLLEEFSEDENNKELIDKLKQYLPIGVSGVALAAFFVLWRRQLQNGININHSFPRPRIPTNPPPPPPKPVKTEGSAGNRREELLSLTEIKVGRSELAVKGQDRTLIDKEHGLFGVFDGAGGSDDGERAAQIASDVVQEVVKQHGEVTDSKEAEALLKRALEAANHEVIRELGKNSYTTATPALIYDDTDGNRKVTWASVGDSRIYVFHEDGSLKQLSEDEGYANVITNSIGHDDAARIKQLKTLTLAEGDLLLLCTDGVTGDRGADILAPVEIISAMLGAVSPEDAADRLVNQVARKIDDRSAVVIDPWK